MSKIFFINVWRKSVFDIYFTEIGTALTTILPILFQYCYKYCHSDSQNLWAVMKAAKKNTNKYNVWYFTQRNAL